jgi:hypothetical protein
MKRPSGIAVNWSGVTSVVSTLAFWAYIALRLPPYSYNLNWVYLGILACGTIATILAARRGSKLWLISLVGQLPGWILFFAFFND